MGHWPKTFTCCDVTGLSHKQDELQRHPLALPELLWRQASSVTCVECMSKYTWYGVMTKKINKIKINILE